MRLAPPILLFASVAFGTTQDQVLLMHLPEHRLVLATRGDTASIDAFDDRFGTKVWTTSGVTTPRLSSVAPNGQLVAIADPVANEVVVVSVADHKSRRHAVPETPVALRFLGSSLFVLSRDGSALTRITGGRTESVRTARSATLLASSADRLFVYSPIEGSIEEFDPEALAVVRLTRVAPFASDFETDRRRGYLVYPRSGKMITITLADLKTDEEFTVGAVPVDALLEGDPNVISAGVVAVADPSSKRIWRVERSQSTGEAFGRGFLRGLLGLGLYSPRSAEFPTGIDRILSAGGQRFAYDSSSGKLYRLGRGKAQMVATLRTPGAFTVAGDRLVIWNEDRQNLEFRPLTR